MINKKPRKKTVVISCVVGGFVIVSVVCGLALIGGDPKIPDASRLSADELDEYIRSGKIRELEPEQRREFFREAMESRTARQAEGYFNTPADMRDVYLDEVIDSMQSRREEFSQMREMFGPDRGGEGMFDPNEFGGRRGGGQGGRFGPRGGRGGEGRREEAGDGRRRGDRQNRRAPSLERRRARQESISPIVRAQTREFRRALRRRMQGR